MSRVDYLQQAIANRLSPLLMAGELSLLGEYPDASLARSVLEAVGNGERTYSGIAARAGAASPVPSGSLTPVLAMLVDKRVVAVDQPLSTQPDTRNRRYRVDDSYLRFWLSFLQRGIPEIDRGRGQLVLARIEKSWSSWRGRAVEPLVRASLARLLPDDAWPETWAVGGCGTGRTTQRSISSVPTASRSLAGSISSVR